MSRRIRVAAAVAVLAVFLSTGAGSALASHGGGGGGGGGPTPPPPATAPAASFSASTVDFGPQAVGSTSATRSITLTNTGSASLFINGIQQSGANALDFGNAGAPCLGLFVPAGTSCVLSFQFTPTATGPRTAQFTIIDTAANSPQTITVTGAGTSTTGPTPLSVDTTGLTCTAGVCALGFDGDQLVKNFYFTNLGVQGQLAPPFTWSLSGGTLPPGVTLFSNGEIFGTPTATGTFRFTVRVTDTNGQAATQAFSLIISPQPPPLTAGQQACQHAPGTTTAALTGPAIAGKTPSGQGIGDQSQLTACGGFTVVTARVSNVNLPNGTILWVTLGGEPIGRITLSGGAGSMSPWTLPVSTLRKQGMGIFTAPPTNSVTDVPILSGPFV
jgi:putative Ig domain-containing protein/HYDIN/CFA65/VesB family protein